MLPESIAITTHKVSAGIPFHPENKQKLQNIFPLLGLPLDEDKRVFISFVNVAKYSPMPYIPGAIGIALGRSVRASPLILMYLARLSNLLLFILLGYFSIKITPVFKWVFLLLLLTPISVFTVASASGDCVTISFSFFLVALFLKYSLIQEAPLDRVGLTGIFLSSSILSLAKPPYQSLCLLFLLIPLKKFRPVGRYLITFFSLLLLCILLSIIVIYSIRELNDVSYVPTMASPNEQLVFLSRQPFQFLIAFFNGWARDGFITIEQLIGILGWLDTRLPTFLIVSYFCILILTSIAGGSKDLEISYFQRFLIFITMLFNVFVISFFLYIHWSPVGANIVDGWQGRYLTPIGILIFLPLYNRKIRLNPRILKILVISYLFFSGSLTVSVLINRYYL